MAVLAVVVVLVGMAMNAASKSNELTGANDRSIAEIRRDILYIREGIADIKATIKK